MDMGSLEWEGALRGQRRTWVPTRARCRGRLDEAGAKPVLLPNSALLAVRIMRDKYYLINNSSDSMGSSAMTYLPVTLTLTPAEKMQRDMALVGVGTCLALVETNRPPQAASAGLRQTPASTAHVPTLRFYCTAFLFCFFAGPPWAPCRGSLLPAPAIRINSHDSRLIAFDLHRPACCWVVAKHYH